jgi:competence protein ComEC
MHKQRQRGHGAGVKAINTLEIMRFSPSLMLSRTAMAVRGAVAAQHGQLFLWVPVALAIGIALHFALPWHHQRQWLLVLLIGIAILVSVLQRVPQKFALMAAVSLVALGLLLAGWREGQVAAPRLTRDVTVTLEVRVIDVTTRHLLVAPLAADRALPPLQRIRLKLPATPTRFEPGQRLRLRARLAVVQSGVSPQGYDFARVAWFQQIGATGRILGTVEVLASEAPHSFSGWFDRARERAARRFQAQIPGEAGAVAGALIVGERNSLSEETTQDMRISGLAHLLSVSGFHLVMVAGALFMGTRHLMALWPWLALHAPTKAIAAVLSVGGALVYTLLTGAAYPTLRSMIAISIVMLGVVLGRTAISLRLMAAVGFVLLLFRPEALLDVSFQLSFTGVAALIAFFEAKRVRAWLSPKADEGWLFRLMRSTGSTLLATFVAELALAPIAVAHFNQLGVYGLLANVIGVPVTGFILMPLGFLCLVLQPFGLDTLVNPLFGAALEYFILFAKWIAHLPHAQIRIPEMGGPAFASFMFGLVVLILARGRLKWACVPFGAAGFALALLVPSPDVRIAPDGKTIGVRTAAGDLVFPNLRAGKFARTSWLEDEATAADDGQAWDAVAEPACRDSVCRVRLGTTGRLLAVLPRAAEPEKCPDVDVLIDLRAIRYSSCTAPLYLDRRWLWDHGATELYFESDKIKIKTYAATVGDHAWR